MKISDLRKICGRATPGPWKADLGNWQIEQLKTRDGICCFDHSSRDGVGDRINMIDPVDDALFMEAFNPSMVLKLLEALSIAGNTLKYIATVNESPLDPIAASLERGDERLLDIREATETLKTMDEILK